MKEINEAYSAIMKMRREGTSSAGGYSGGAGYGAGYGGYGSYGGYDRQEASPHMQAARNYIRAGHFQEAMHLLEGILDRTAEWYYLAGEASLGLGNRIAALSYARQAVNMDPMCFEYRALLSRLEGNAQYYQTNGATGGFTMPGALCGNPFLTCCLANIICNCCCGGRFIYC